MSQLLESEEAARRLGVKLPTLYAYVSRGLLTSQRAADGKRSLFDLDQIEAFARRSRGGRQVETRLATVTTAITQLRNDGPSYRGQRTAGLATTATYEEVAALLWEDDRARWQPLSWFRLPACRTGTCCDGRWSWPAPVMRCGPTCARQRSSRPPAG